MRDVAVELSKPGATAKASRVPAFSEGLERLAQWVRNGAPKERLEALTVLARLRRQQNRAFPSGFEAILAEPIEPLTALPALIEDAKEREYLAQGLALVRFPGQAQYLAGFVASEGQAKTDARDSAALVLLRCATSLTQVFEELSIALSHQTHETKDPAASRTRRLQRVLEAIQTALRDADPIVSQDTGGAYSRLLRGSLSTGVERAVAIEITNAALALLLAWVRPNFSVALQPQTFEALHEVRRMFSPARWPDETRESRAAVGRLLREAIALLAQAGVTDDRLKESLILAVDEPVALGMLRTLANDAPGLANPVRHWLETGRKQPVSSGSTAVTESVLETFDNDLAEVFRDGQAVSDAIGSLANDLDEAISLANPALGEQLGDLVSRIARVTRQLDAFAAKRGFELRGTVGEAVEYSPADHVSDLPIVGMRVVRLVSPMVVRRSAGGAPRLILRGKVEPG